MSTVRDFADAAKGLSKSPLGIIALFLILVYAVASLVISFAKPEFFQYASHPVVVFLATFPVIVLFVFAYLVARHHTKLYAPYEFKNQEDFFRTLRVPEAVSTTSIGIATSDSEDVAAEADIQTAINESYEKLAHAGLCVIHETEVLQPRTSPGSGRYRVRVWIESFAEKNTLSDVESVTYRVWSDFRNNTLTTANKSSNFDLWLNIYGEFPLLAFVKMRDGSTIELQRYLDLPGRPPD